MLTSPKKYYNELVEIYRFQLFFKGQLVENSADAFDVASTIIATTQSLQEILSIRYGEEAAKGIKLNINAFKEGSLVSDFILFFDQVKDAAIPLIPLAGNVYDVGKTMISGLNTYINVKKLLKGKPPKAIQALSGGQKFEITANDNATIVINNYDLRALQSKTLARTTAKAVQPLIKDASLLEEIGLRDESQTLTVSKEESAYIVIGEETQALEGVKYKGTISKIDTKAHSGFLDLGSKRLAFIFPRDIEQMQLHILVSALESKIQVYLIGNVTMDFEGNPSSMNITRVESEVNLFNESNEEI
ncbi:MAG: hypothetical protein Q7R69_01325 [bacterium]|nr:hypothetical protein [bacterium]